jgi:hypothetical protein
MSDGKLLLHLFAVAIFIAAYRVAVGVHKAAGVARQTKKGQRKTEHANFQTGSKSAGKSRGSDHLIPKLTISSNRKTACVFISEAGGQVVTIIYLFAIGEPGFVGGLGQNNALPIGFFGT